MTNERAKFVLGAYRPNGADAKDPMFAEALEQAKRDPNLAAWFAALTAAGQSGEVHFVTELCATIRALPAPQTPRPLAMRVHAGRPLNGPKTSSPFGAAI